ncbi:hypothetical protein J8L98_03880 [Pseudoalteromonas sp. MMG013]|uniref:hypothetical protein n=1 Tax=Pseudoalteromonas sp. MMG013 TaxID=2822687 RepID=UPI001B38E804|nr:hypothetical protein [Pseudoalteromonas sp. MMG013]MBQ4860835.1 hypothetical protein [Pseudoalteromonas sp. MMG013]
MINKEKRIDFKKKLFVRFVSYYRDNQHYGFIESNGELQLEKVDSTKLIQIVAACHCEESIKKLPTANKTALKGIIKLLRLKSETASSVTSVRHQSDSSTFVNIWQLQNKGAFIQIPENMLLAEQLQEKQVAIIRNKYFLAMHNNVIYSALKLGVINKPERFANSVGIAFEKTLNVEHDAQLANAFFTGYWFTLVNNLSQLLQPKALNSYKHSISRGVKVLGLTLSGYLLATSGYLFWKNHSLTKELENNKQAINEALFKYEEYQKNTNHLNELNGVFNEHYKKSFIFFIVNKVRAFASIERVSFSGETVLFKGKSGSSIAVLEFINSIPGVIEAKFHQPVRSYQGVEEFVVSFQFNNHDEEVNQSLLSEGGEG